jgi:NitT/TauT family transport system permease protein
MKKTSEAVQVIVPFGKPKYWTRILLAVVTALLLVLIWQLYTAGGGLIPGPGAVLKRLGGLVGSRDFITNLFTSIGLTFKAMLIAIVIALAMGYLSVIPVFRPFARFIVKCRYLTITGLFFIFILIAKDADKLKLSLLVFGIVPFFVTSMLAVIANIQNEEYDAARTLRYNQWQTLVELIIVGRMDQIIEIIRQNFAIAWIMIVTVESSALSGGGIGTMLYRYNRYNDLRTTLSLQIVILLLGIGIDQLLLVMRRQLFPYTQLTTSADS